MLGSFPYRDWSIHQTGFYAHPDWWKIQWTCSHKDYDGDGDNRCFVCADLEECQFEIDCWYEDQ